MPRPRSGPRPGALGGPELDDQLDVGMLSGGIAAGGHGLDLAQERRTTSTNRGNPLPGQVLPARARAGAS